MGDEEDPGKAALLLGDRGGVEGGEPRLAEAGCEDDEGAAAAVSSETARRAARAFCWSPCGTGTGSSGSSVSSSGGSGWRGRPGALLVAGQPFRRERGGDAPEILEARREADSRPRVRPRGRRGGSTRFRRRGPSGRGCCSRRSRRRSDRPSKSQLFGWKAVPGGVSFAVSTTRVSRRPRAMLARSSESEGTDQTASQPRSALEGDGLGDREVVAGQQAGRERPCARSAARSSRISSRPLSWTNAATIETLSAVSKSGPMCARNGSARALRSREGLAFGAR